MADKINGRFLVDQHPVTLLPAYREDQTNSLYTAAYFVDPVTQRKGNNASFSTKFIFPSDHPQLQPLRKLMASLLQETFPSIVTELAQRAKANPATPLWDLLCREFAIPLKSGRADVAYETGKFVLDAGTPGLTPDELAAGKAGTHNPPVLAGFENGACVDYVTPMALGMAKSRFFAGAEVLFMVNLKTHKVGTNKPGVKAYLSQVCVTGNGSPLFGGPPPSQTFGSYKGSVSDFDPTRHIGAGETVEDLL